MCFSRVEKKAMPLDAKSKAFRATLPRCLTEHQLAHLRRWMENNCACASLFRDDSRKVVLICLQAKARSSASFSRTLRTAMTRMVIDPLPKGNWVTLLSKTEALSIINHHEHTNEDAPRGPLPGTKEGGPDVKTVFLH